MLLIDNDYRRLSDDVNLKTKNFEPKLWIDLAQGKGCCRRATRATTPLDRRCRIYMPDLSRLDMHIDFDEKRYTMKEDPSCFIFVRILLGLFIRIVVR